MITIEEAQNMGLVYQTRGQKWVRIVQHGARSSRQERVHNVMSARDSHIHKLSLQAGMTSSVRLGNIQQFLRKQNG